MQSATVETARFVPNRPRRSLSDPFDLALRPPEGEDEQARQSRLRREWDAKQRSDRIDDMLKAEQRERKKRRQVHVLLLGQSESGKSTTLKQFQLLHTPATFHKERIAWRSVIYLNLVRSIHRILEAIEPDPDAFLEPSTHGRLDYGSADSSPSIIISSQGLSPSALTGTPVPHYDRFARRLDPILQLEDQLIRRLSTPDDEHERESLDGEPTHLGPPPGYALAPPNPQPAWEVDDGRGGPGGPHRALTINTAALSRSPSSSTPSPSPSTPRTELSIHSTNNWKKALGLGGKNMQKGKAREQNSNEMRGWWEDPEDPVHIMNAFAPLMNELWRDPSVRQRLAERRLRLEESSGFFLDDIDRITALRYIPTDDDVLKARIKTLGVVEHSFTLKHTGVGSGNGSVDWKIYDVGGARNQRHAWAPYFDNVNAIIFLAPISAFDQVLAEDPRVNRLEDSLKLWREVVSNPLLSNVNIVLFLNKCDLLQRKLASGVRLSQYMPKYANNPNTYEAVSKYFRHKFVAIHQTFTPNKERDFFPHHTAVIDTQKTRLIIHQVRDIILKANLKYSHLV